MKLIDMLQAAGGMKKSKRQALAYDANAARKAIYEVLSSNPMSKAQIIKGTNLSESVVSRTLKEMVRCESALGVFPGEFGRRMMYIRGK